MEVLYSAIGSAVVAGVIAYFIGYFIVVPKAAAKNIDKAKTDAESITQKARQDAEKRSNNLVSEAKSEASRRQKDADRDIRQRTKEFERRENSFLKAEEKLAEQLDKVDSRRGELDKRSGNLTKREDKLKDKEDERLAELERISLLSLDDARSEILAVVEEKSNYQAAQLRYDIEQNARSEANDIARKLIVKAVFRCAVDHYSDSLITSVELKNDEMKGRIIGREGRNIRAIEAATGVDVIIDDTPNTVVLSSFDGVRREVARMALERLIQDGRIHPAKIEEIVEGCRELVQEEMWRAGQEATFRTGITGLNPEMIKLLGRLKYRTSYGQNVLAHSVEVSILSGLLASELGINPKNAKRGGLLHDVGKGADPELEGSHPEVGALLARKYGENSIIVNCIEGHHGDVEQTLEASIVQVADAISAVRPGARGEALHSYLHRLQALEELATSFAGVEKCYAISAGRELRVLVKPEAMDDVLTHDLCGRIRDRIESDLEYPGTIKVTVIRETREVATAK